MTGYPQGRHGIVQESPLARMARLVDDRPLGAHACPSCGCDRPTYSLGTDRRCGCCHRSLGAWR